MHEQFNYEDVFMGVVLDKPRNKIRTFREDYRLKRLTEAVVLKKGRMLDIGCGGGVFTESLAHYFPKANIYGCDISKTAISYAKKLGSGKVTYSVIKNKRLPYRSNFFDVCVCLDVMEHIPDVDYFLKEVKRILKKNGVFFLLVPCEGQPFTYTWLFQKLQFGEKLTYSHWGHIHPEFTHDTVNNLLNKHGFSIIKKTYSEHLLWQFVSLLVYFIPHAVMDFLMGKKAKEFRDTSVIRAKVAGKNSNSIMMFLRNSCLRLNDILRYLTYWETDVFKHIPFAAWKIHILATK